MEGKAIAPNPTNQNVVFVPASRPLTTNETKNRVSSIARTFKDSKGLQISETVIRGKILELYPNYEDWLSGDARKEVIKALEKEIATQ